MIVLDEQLHGYDFPTILGRWYKGAIITIIQLRPHTLIPDTDVPRLLHSVRQPTFVTINVSDFWRKISPDRRFCVVCLPLTDRDVEDVPILLRQLFKLGPFSTRQRRLGKIVRAGRERVQYYSIDSWAVQTVDWPKRKR